MGSACSHTNKSKSPRELAISAPFPSAGLSKASTTTVTSSYSQQTLSDSQTEVSVTETELQGAILASLILQTPPRVRSNKSAIKAKDKLSPMRRIFGIFKKKRKRDEVEEEVEKFSEVTEDSILCDTDTIVAEEAQDENISGVMQSSLFSSDTVKTNQEVDESDKTEKQSEKIEEISSIDFVDSSTASTLKKSSEKGVELSGKTDESEHDDFYTGADYSVSDLVESLISVRDPGELEASYKKDYHKDIRSHAINLELLYHGRTLSPAEKDWLSQQVAGLVKILLDKGSIPENISFVDGMMPRRRSRREGYSDNSYSESDSYMGEQSNMPAPSSHRKHRLKKLLQLGDSDDNSTEEIDLSYDPHGTKYLKYEKREKRKTTQKYKNVIQELSRKLSEQNIKKSESASSVNSFFTASDFNDNGKGGQKPNAENKESPKPTSEVSQKKKQFVRVRVNEYSGKQNLKSRCNSEPFIFAKSSEKKNVEMETVKTKPLKRDSPRSNDKTDHTAAATASSQSTRVKNAETNPAEVQPKEENKDKNAEEKEKSKQKPTHGLPCVDKSAVSIFESGNAPCTLVEKEYDFNGASSDSHSCCPVLEPENDKTKKNVTQCESKSDKASTQIKTTENRPPQSPGDVKFEFKKDRSSHEVKTKATRNSVTSPRFRENRSQTKEEDSDKIKPHTNDKGSQKGSSSYASPKHTTPPSLVDSSSTIKSGARAKTRSPRRTSTPKKSHRSRSNTPVPMLESIAQSIEGRDIHDENRKCEFGEKPVDKSQGGDYKAKSRIDASTKTDATAPICRAMAGVNILEEPPKPKPRSRPAGPVPSPRTRKSKTSLSPRENNIKCEISSRTVIPTRDDNKLIEMPRKQFRQMELPSMSPPIPDLQEIRSARIKSAQNHQRRLKKVTEKRREEKNYKLKNTSPPNVVPLARTPSIRKHRSKEGRSRTPPVDFDTGSKYTPRNDGNSHTQKKSPRGHSGKLVRGDSHSSNRSQRNLEYSTASKNEKELNILVSENAYSNHRSHSGDNKHSKSKVNKEKAKLKVEEAQNNITSRDVHSSSHNVERSDRVRHSKNRGEKTKVTAKIDEKLNIALSDTSIKSPQVLNNDIQTKLSFTSRKTLLQPLVDISPRRQSQRKEASRTPTRDIPSSHSTPSETESLKANKKQSRVTFKPVQVEFTKQDFPSQNFEVEQPMTQIFSNLDPLQMNFQQSSTYSPFLNTSGVANVPQCQPLQFGNAIPTFSTSLRSPQVSAQTPFQKNFQFQQFSQGSQFGEPNIPQYSKFHFNEPNQNQLLTWASPFHTTPLPPSQCTQSNITPPRINVSGCYFPNSAMTSNVYTNQQPFNYGLNFTNTISQTTGAFSPTLQRKPEDIVQTEKDRNPTLDRFNSVSNNLSQNCRTSETSINNLTTASKTSTANQSTFQSNKLSQDRKAKSVECISNDTEKKLSSSKLKNLTNSEGHLEKSPQKHRKWRQCLKEKDEGDAWWMPKDWAKERGIGTFGNQWSFEKEEAEKKERELEIAKDANIEQIRMSRSDK